MVNDWTGGAQVGDKFIMATALGAGKKDPETNTFSGIIIGDLKQAIQAQSEDSSSKYEKINTTDCICQVKQSKYFKIIKFIKNR